jgi:hypothetical protein
MKLIKGKPSTKMRLHEKQFSGELNEHFLIPLYSKFSLQEASAIFSLVLSTFLAYKIVTSKIPKLWILRLIRKF